MRDDIVHLAGDAGPLGRRGDLTLLIAFDQQLTRAVDHRLDVALAATDVHADQRADQGQGELTCDAVHRRHPRGGADELEQNGQDGHRSHADAERDPGGARRAVHGDRVARHEQHGPAGRLQHDEVADRERIRSDARDDGPLPAAQQQGAGEQDEHGERDVRDDRLRRRSASAGVVDEYCRRGCGEEQADQGDQHIGQHRMACPEPTDDAGGTRQPQRLLIERSVAAAAGHGSDSTRHVCAARPRLRACRRRPMPRASYRPRHRRDPSHPAEGSRSAPRTSAGDRPPRRSTPSPRRRR